MFVLRRLVEDVAVLQTLEQAQRRKEIYSALTSNMEQIFAFLLELLEKHYGAYKASGADEHCRVCLSILETFSSLVEWVSIQHVMANNRYLLHCLTHLLSDPRLQLPAAECLLGIVGWRAGKVMYCSVGKFHWSLVHTFIDGRLRLKTPVGCPTAAHP